MKWEFFGGGLAVIAIGLTLVLALPPPWWPKMPASVVHSGILLGVTLCNIGLALRWPGENAIENGFDISFCHVNSLAQVSILRTPSRRDSPRQC